MSKRTKLFLIVAASLVLIGCIIFGSVMTVFNWDFRKLSTTTFETNCYEIDEGISSISIVTNAADIELVPTDKSYISVICYEDIHLKHSVTAKDGTLTITKVDTRKWYHYIGINFITPKITVKLPQAEYNKLTIKDNTGDITISKDFKFETISVSGSTGKITNYASATGTIQLHTSTGAVSVKSITAGTLDITVTTGFVSVSNVTCNADMKLNVSTGKANISNLNCQSFISTGDTGDLSMVNVNAINKFSIKRSTGDIKFNKCDASEILITTNTGNVLGSLLSDKVFITETDTGSINVPKSTTGGKCEITTDTGDIKIKIEP